MKKIPTAASAGKYLLMFLLILWLAPANSLYAQEEPAAEEETMEEEEPSLISSRMSLYATQFPGDTIELQALLRAKIDNVYQKIGDAEIEFFIIGDEEETSLGKVTTDGLGTAILTFSATKIPLNAEGYLSFAARFAGNEELEESEGDVSILKARMTVTPVKEDSIFKLIIKVTAPSAEGEIAVAEADAAIFVKRLFGKLKVGEGTTDENGEVEIEFPDDIPGDDAGNLFISAKIEDFEEYGNIAANTIQPWGIPVSSKVEALPRALWSPNPPVWMVVTFFVLMTAVWGHYAVIVYNLYQIKKKGKVA